MIGRFTRPALAIGAGMLLVGAPFAPAHASAPPSEPSESDTATDAVHAPSPLAERVSLKIGLSGYIENYLPLFLADRYGEFEAENIEVEFVLAPPTDQVQLLAAGQIDVSVQAIGLASFNAIATGVDMKFVYPMAARGTPDDTGWWVRNDVIGEDGFQGSDLNGATLVSPSGATGLSPAILVPALEAEDPEFDASSLEHIRMDLPDMPIALTNGSVDGGHITSPFDQPVEESGCCTYIDHFVDWPTTAIIFNADLRADRDLGLAFLRAVDRTVATYLVGDYHQDEQLVADTAEILGQEEETILSLNALIFTQELPVDDMMATQEYYRTIPDAISYDTDLEADDVFDLSFYDELHG